MVSRLVENARRLRRDATDAKDLLWQMLRGRRFGGFKFRRQVPVQPFILDLYRPQAGLAVEVDGGQHSDPEHAARDQERTAFLSSQEIRVLRFWNHDVLCEPEAVASRLWTELHDAHPPPDPLPPASPAGEGDNPTGND
ncbi:MAG: DUF559 domain-containing protein [Myxococcales bacterium]|nr:DUF559 domain-containing protein [Myxococcales bacterium]